MGKHRRSSMKFRERRIRNMLSAVCVLGIFLVCFGVAGYQNRVKAENGGVVTRGVIDSIEQIPQTKKDLYDAGEDVRESLGTKENPLVILEIVPYEEYALFGYHISGCEPTDVNRAQTNAGYMGLLKSLSTATIKQQDDAYFFTDEPESEESAYPADQGKITRFNTYGLEYEGYYAYVGDGQGCFTQNSDGTITKVQKNQGNIKWHTMCQSEKEDLLADHQDITYYNSTDAMPKLEEADQKVYAKRISSESDPVYYANKIYYYYKNNDFFLKNTLEIPEDQVSDYSVVIKTITPEELNKESDWANYADLFIFSRKEYYGGLKNFYQDYNRFGHTVNTNKTYVNSFVNDASSDQRDISWTVAEKIFDRVTAEDNFAGIVMGSSLYTPSDDALKGSIVSDGSGFEVYDWNLKKTGKRYAGDARSNNHVYKLALMLMTMDQDLFKATYMNDSNGNKKLIDDTGKFTLRSNEKNTDGSKSNQDEYWSMYTFLLIDSSLKSAKDNPYGYWTDGDKSKGMWSDYEISGNLTMDRTWIKDHVFAFNDDNTLSFEYSSGNTAKPNEKFSEYQSYLDEYYNEKEHGGSPSDAVRYILKLKDKKDRNSKGLKVLDLEPCYDSKNGYTLTETYLHWMLPKYKGTITLTHMTTAEFIGKSEDLNSTYQMIYMGLDDGAYNKKTENRQDPVSWEWVTKEYTTWNDPSMNGKIYFHSGDSMMSAEWNISTNKKKRTHSVKFLANGNNSGLLRFPGNDITELKKKELENFLAAGYPIVAAGDLYNRNSLYIDQSSVISKFVEESTAMGSAKSFYKSSDTSKIYAALETAGDVVTFSDGAQLANSTEETPHYRSQMPIRYQDKTVENESGKNGYLKRNALGESELDFGYILKDTEHAYGYHIYMDQNQDGKFAEEELYAQGDAQAQGQTGEIDEESDGAFTTISYTLAKSYVGMIEWKFEIYRKDNPAIRYEETGCSAAKIQNASDKKQVKILQIVPNNDVNLNLNDSKLFKKYYSQLDDYKIWTNNNNYVDVMTADEYMAVFSGAGNQFVYDESADLEFEEGALNPSQFPSGAQRLNKDYNMIIVGFGDTYGGTNISNENGALDFIKFFIAEGKSVLFTHDLTSLYNLKKENASIFGYTANALLRDTMGMNRYGAISNQASQEEQKKIAQLQQNNVAANSNYYETIADDAKQGFTYYAMKRLGWSNNNNGTPLDTLKKQKVPYRYMINSYQNDESICGKSELSKTTGFNDNNDITTRVTQTNQGQITEYPYKIDPEFTIARTHGQWYQLNMEDPEVTVWYCLADNENGNPAAWNDKEQYGDGTGATYGVSPNDAANNYYIYSKGNVFYSGVGHSTVDGDMEAKLFVNTMIAAYRAAYESPTVRVTNGSWCDDVSTEDDRHYKVLIPESELSPEELMEDEAASTVDIMKDDTYKITFRPEDHNPVTSQLTASVYYADASGKKIADVEEITALDGSPVSKNKKGEWELNNMQEYAFKYPEMYLQEWTDEAGQTHEKQCRIVFKIKNTKNKIPGYTKLDISTLPMFQLD